MAVRQKASPTDRVDGVLEIVADGSGGVAARVTETAHHQKSPRGISEPLVAQAASLFYPITTGWQPVLRVLTQL